MLHNLSLATIREDLLVLLSLGPKKLHYCKILYGTEAKKTVSHYQYEEKV